MCSCTPRLRDGCWGEVDQGVGSPEGSALPFLVQEWCGNCAPALQHNDIPMPQPGPAALTNPKPAQHPAPAQHLRAWYCSVCRNWGRSGLGAGGLERFATSSASCTSCSGGIQADKKGSLNQEASEKMALGHVISQLHLLPRTDRQRPEGELKSVSQVELPECAPIPAYLWSAHVRQQRPNSASQGLPPPPTNL